MPSRCLLNPCISIFITTHSQVHIISDMYIKFLLKQTQSIKKIILFVLQPFLQIWSRPKFCNGNLIVFIHLWNNFAKPNFVEQHIKLLLAMAVTYKVLLQIPAAPLLVQHPANVPEKTVENGSSIWAPATHTGNIDLVSRLLLLLWNSPGFCGTWGVNKHMEDFFISLFFPFALSLCPSNKFSTIKNRNLYLFPLF